MKSGLLLWPGVGRVVGLYPDLQAGAVGGLAAAYSAREVARG